MMPTQKSKMVKSGFDTQIAELAGKSGHKTLAIWALDCAERVLPYFERDHPSDDRPRLAIEAGRMWVKTNQFRMASIRGASLDAHAAARDAEDASSAQSAARAAGQAVATAHVSTHAVAAAIYAATAVRDASGTDPDAAVACEREWQYRHLLELQRG